RAPAAGASGALCGILAALIVWVFINRGHLPPQIASAWMRSLTINAVLIIGISLLPGISAAGHLGGAVGGAVFTLPFLWERYRTGWRRWVGLAGMLLAPVLAVTVAVGATQFTHGLRIRLQEAEEAAISSLTHYALPFLQKGNVFDDPVAVQDALRDFADTESKLQSALAAFDNFLNPIRDPRVRDMLSSWLDFYQAFSAALQSGQWAVQTHNDLLPK